MRRRYYSDAKIFVWLRKKLHVDKPRAMSWGKWDEWDSQFKSERPIAFFLTETLPDWAEWIPDHTIGYIDEIRSWCSNYFGNTHGLQSTLRRGKWHEFDERLLHSCFDSFIDFVECEVASRHIGWGDDDQKRFGLTWKDKYWATRGGKRWRCMKAGIDHLQWEMALYETPENTELTMQGKNAVEMLILYTWWKDVYPNRKEVWEVTGFQKFWDSLGAKYGKSSDWLGLGGPSKMTAAEKVQYDLLSAANEELEKQRNNEDTEMLTRLIKIRSNLWT